MHNKNATETPESKTQNAASENGGNYVYWVHV